MKDVTDFLSTLIDKAPQLFILLLGAFMLTLSGADKLPLMGGIPMAVPTRIGCAFMGIGLVLYAMWALYSNEKIRISKKDQTLEGYIQLIENQKQDISEKDAEIINLKELLVRARKIASEKGYGDVKETLDGITETVITAEERFKVLKRAAEWVRVKTESHVWTDEIEVGDFREFGINRQNINEFRDELTQHLEALQENLKDMIPRGLPRKRGAFQVVAKSPLAYKKALQRMMPNVVQDLEKSYELDELTRGQIQAYFEVLIDIADA